MKQKKTKAAVPPAKPAEPKGISRTGKKIIGAGIVVLIAGYFVLTKTDPAGQNWASTVAPFLILGGYALIGIGIVAPDIAGAGKEAGK
jgi:hypothetical protein